MSNSEIAGRLGISPMTAKTYAAHVLTKLDGRDRVQLVILAYRAGLGLFVAVVLSAVSQDHCVGVVSPSWPYVGHNHPKQGRRRPLGNGSALGVPSDVLALKGEA